LTPIDRAGILSSVATNQGGKMDDDKRTELPTEDEWREHLRKQDRWDRRIGLVAALLFILALTIVWAEKITGGML
jgi:hypothetical protein